MGILFRKQDLFFTLILSFSLFLCSSLNAQINMNTDSTLNAESPAGRLWGYAFGDFYYKAHSDLLVRDGVNQFTGIPQKRNAFTLHHIYLGYNYNINKKFSTELLLAAEDNATSTSLSGIT